MTTKTIQQKKTGITNQKANKITDVPVISNTGEYKDLPIDQISFSPFNYRKLFSEKDLQDFAAEILQHGIISPLTVRPLPSGNYELVAGERRMRAAKIAGLMVVPVVIKDYNDEQVREIQLAENLQRENPHPMHEAFAIGYMQKAGKKTDEISARLGKSKQFIYMRIKLLALIEPIQEIFLNDVINLQDAIEIARVSAESQIEFFNSYCREWKKRRNFEINNLENKLDQFKYDLKEAPFNTKDKNLIPDAGACNVCESNTATLKTLFPEFAKQAICNNRACYHKKCAAHFTIEFTSAFLEHAPDALIFNGDLSDSITALIQSVKGAGELSAYSRYDIDIVNPPEMPVTEDYISEEEIDGEEVSQFDEKGFNEALEEYEEELEQYTVLMQSGKLQKGLLVMENSIRVLAFSPEKQAARNAGHTVTAKEVQTSLKSGTATTELLEAEIERLNNKEARAKQLDREKVQLVIHEKFSSEIESVSNITSLTTADQVAARLLIYQSLNYYTRGKVGAQLFTSTENEEKEESQMLYEKLAALTDNQYSYLIRNAIACQADSKFPLNSTGFFLYKQAEGAGLNIESIEHLQEQKAMQRQGKQEEKIRELENQISKLKSKA